MTQSLQMDQGDNRPKWLLELENRKRKPRLAHEVGAGAPCLKCDASCPGLDLHFWRKICKNCKCGRDDHDVPDDEFPQFDLLLGSSGKSKRRHIVLKMNKQHVDEEETFEWAPPDTTQELAADYMKALPEDKLPIKGSAGAALRKQQLQKQLPLHDIDHKMCDELSESERKQFEKYLENLKKYVGQGKVSKIVCARPFDRSLMTPANASECLSPKHTSITMNNQPPINLRTPSSFVPKSTYQSVPQSFLPSHEQLLHANENNAIINDTNNIPSRLDNICNPTLVQATDESVKLARYHHIRENLKNDDTTIIESSNVFGGTHYPTTNSPSSNKLSNNENLTNKSDVPIDQCEVINSAENKSIDPNTEYNNTTDVMAFENNENANVNLNNIPLPLQLQRLGTIVGEQSTVAENTMKTPLRSNPLNKQSVKSSDDVLNEHLNHPEHSMLMVNKMLSDALLPPSAIRNNDIIGSTLDEKGLSNIREKLMAKYSVKDEPVDHSINPGQCSPLMSRNQKRENVQDNNVQSQSINSMNTDINSKPMLAQINSYKNPENTIIRSEKLQNPVFPNEAIGTSRMSIDNLQLAIDNMSINQSKESKVQKCHNCDEAIHTGDVVVTAEKATDAAWHPGCFVCCACNELLVDLVYFYYKGKLYCARDLASLMEIPRCFACDELIFVREYTVAEGHNYHVKHFCCWDCDVPLAGKQYISENDRPLCLHCYQKTYAKMCCTCDNLIAADQQGVAVKNLNFHATDDCFCCYNCKKTLLNGRMAIKQDKPFCSKECITTYLNENTN